MIWYVLYYREHFDNLPKIKPTSKNAFFSCGWKYTASLNSIQLNFFQLTIAWRRSYVGSSVPWKNEMVHQILNVKSSANIGLASKMFKSWIYVVRTQTCLLCAVSASSAASDTGLWLVTSLRSFLLFMSLQSAQFSLYAF